MNERPTRQVNVSSSQRRPAWLLPAAAIALIATVALVFVLVAPREGRPAGTAGASPTATATATASAPSATPTATAGSTTVTPTPAGASPTAAAGVASAAFGLVVSRPQSGPSETVVRSETDARGIVTLETRQTGTSFRVAVAPDGRRLAFWSTDARQLRLWDAAAPGSASTLYDLPAGEFGTSVVWASDGAGVLLTSQTSPSAPGIDAPPATALARTLELATRQPREVHRVQEISLVAIGWDRARSLAALTEVGGGGFSRAYIVVPGSGAARRTELRGVVNPVASADARWVVGVVYDTSAGAIQQSPLRAWPLDDPAAAKELRPSGVNTLGQRGWRPGTTEVLVSEGATGPGSFQTQYSLWDPSTNARRALAIDGGVSAFRADGNALYVSELSPGARLWVHDLATGRRDPLPVAEGQRESIWAGVRVR